MTPTKGLYMWNYCSPPAPRRHDDDDTLPAEWHTPPLLWAIWALSVVGAAIWVWWGAASAGQPLDFVLLVVRCTLVGLGGLVVLTLLEMRLAPGRFLG